MTLPFGKYRSAPLPEVPGGYLAWALEEATLSPALAAAIREELADRLGLEPEVVHVEVPARPPAVLRPAIRALVRQGFRQLAITAHPDQGGTNEGMRQLLGAKDWLEALTS